ncbi:hypothetical protein CVT26_006950 [Gymnopilus dilepis]|uniref:Uncharacterized protein n=1 Tax=Gymnopilus dilepis TaxID=231916 RepID=A0A409W6B5_9AGAR|nr:hypothetical protein CVT26_006950 [Gymnopilus dilepis]
MAAAMPTERKRKKRFDLLSDLELVQTLNAIKNLRQKCQKQQALGIHFPNADNEAENEQETQEEVQTEEDILQSLISLELKLEGRLMGPQSNSFSTINDDHLAKMGISSSQVLQLKDDAITRGLATNTIGEGEHWSANGLVRHLRALEGLVPKMNEAAARLWINALFFRVSTMIPDGKKMIFSVGQGALHSPQGFDTIFGSVNSIAIMTTMERARHFMRRPQLPRLTAEDSALFVSEAKGPDQRLVNHVPQAVSEMYAFAKHMEKRLIRGAVTNGHEWIFLVVKLNEDGNGAQYAESDLLSVVGGIVSQSIQEEAVSLLSAIVAYWMQHSHEELDDEDFFMYA